MPTNLGRGIGSARLGTAAAVALLLASASAGAQAPPRLSDRVIVGTQTFTLPENGPNQFLAAFAGPFNGANQWVGFAEPAALNDCMRDPTKCSDRLSLRAGFLYFESDVGGVLPPLFLDLPAAAAKYLEENGRAQRVDQYFVGTNLPNVQVISDVEPEPATVVLLAGGLAVLGVGCWRRRSGPA